MMQDFTNSDDDDIEIIACSRRHHGEYDDISDSGTECDVSTVGIFEDVDGHDHNTKPRRRGRQIISLSIGLLIGIMISMALFIVANVRSGGSRIPSIFTSKVDEQMYCPWYKRPPSFAGKKGLALQLIDNLSAGRSGSSLKNTPILKSLRPYWNYGWSLVRSSMQPDDIEWVPMAWGGIDANTVKQRIDAYVVPHIKSGKVKRILGFNEPDAAQQANMMVKTALDLWPVLEYTNVSVISPACAKPAGAWMQSFMTNATKTCKRVDWVAVHWYGLANFTTFRNMMVNYYTKYGKRPIILTEFAVADFSATTLVGNNNTREEALTFMKQALPWLESRPWIVGYAWFPYTITDIVGWPSALFDDSGQLTPLGQYYASVRTDTPTGNQTIEWQTM